MDKGMIYTVGDREAHDLGIEKKAEKGERLMKLGMGKIGSVMYRGGMVWSTPLEAWIWITAKIQQEEARADLGSELADQALRQAQALAVYGVEADWERDTQQYVGEQFRRLIVSRPLVKLPEVGQAYDDGGEGAFTASNSHLMACGG